MNENKKQMYEMEELFVVCFFLCMFEKCEMADEMTLLFYYSFFSNIENEKR